MIFNMEETKEFKIMQGFMFALAKDLKEGKINNEEMELLSKAFIGAAKETEKNG